MIAFLFSSSLYAQTDLQSFCFEENVSLKQVQQSVSFLLLPKDTVNLREEDHCIDIVASADRGKLFEKFLAGRYNLKQEKAPVEIEPCHLSLKTTVRQKSETDSVKVGEKNSVKKIEQMASNTSTMEFVFSQGIPGELEAGAEKLKVTCRFYGSEKGSLQFQFAEKNKGAIATELMVRRGEWLNIGSIVKDLNDKNKTLGIPQTEITSTNGTQESQYELQLK